MIQITILDGYIDEPACLGVPPYISPYVRYMAGAILHHRPDIHLNYLTIDQIRTPTPETQHALDHSDLILVIVGMTVPGRYLSGHPASPQELKRYLQNLTNSTLILLGPAARHGFGMEGGKTALQTPLYNSFYDLIAPGDPEIITRDLLQNDFDLTHINPHARRKDPHEIAPYAKLGAPLLTQHPFFPDYLICEIETYRGCTRSIHGGCSFCSEPEKGLPQFRRIKDIHDEIKALYDIGIRHFRLGNQPCIFSFMAHDVGTIELPRPNPDALEQLFSGIREVAPQLKTLHIDNANPGVIARYPEECKAIAETIVHHHTSGDVAAMGVESADPDVIKANNLKADPEEALEAIRLINKVGAQRGDNGLPELLPGINLLYGLLGETKKTYKKNLQFLTTIKEEGLLLRRINIRKVIPLQNTELLTQTPRILAQHQRLYQHFKHQVKTTIEQPLLKRLVPPGTLLTNVYIEAYDGNLSFGRQLGSYPLLVGIPGRFPKHVFYDVSVIDYGYRSITGLPIPFPLNSAPKEAIEALPGIGKKRAQRILRSRPIHTVETLQNILDDPTLATQLLPLLTLKD